MPCRVVRLVVSLFRFLFLKCSSPARLVAGCCVCSLCLFASALRGLCLVCFFLVVCSVCRVGAPLCWFWLVWFVRAAVLVVSSLFVGGSFSPPFVLFVCFVVCGGSAGNFTKFCVLFPFRELGTLCSLPLPPPLCLGRGEGERVYQCSADCVPLPRFGACSGCRGVCCSNTPPLYGCDGSGDKNQHSETIKINLLCAF